jgi:DNA-binding MarR family transcriptional regulator
MTSVKTLSSDDGWHAAALLGTLMEELRDTIISRQRPELRVSHFRVLGSVPPAGITVTELAERVGMTKQGCGQFVTQLVESGHLRVEADPTDRRLRIVRRTRSGVRTTAAITARIVALESEWAEIVGPRRYATFRTVLEELALRER